MSVWKEIRCDAVPILPECHSGMNRGPQGFEPVQDLLSVARKEGWLVLRSETICPVCRKAKP